MTLTKAITLEYMVTVAKPITAKELSIDLDSRASTASELLERMTAQGLCTRETKQRPREYVLTDAGRESLAWCRAQDCARSQRANGGNEACDARSSTVTPGVNGSFALALREV